jgi:hypothetical protein
MLLTAVAAGFGGVNLPVAHAAVFGGKSLSLIEMNGGFDKLLLRATMNKTLIYVDRLYFDYSPLSSNGLLVTENEDTDYVVLDISNEAGEWARVWGYVRKEKGIRPDDPAMREMDLTYIEVNQYWEWRTFTNEERWKIMVKDGYKTVQFTFDMNDRKDGAVYYIDGAYALPEHYYPQVAYWWDLPSANRELCEIRDNYREQAVSAAKTTPEGEPLRLEPVEYHGETSQSPTRTVNMSLGSRQNADTYSDIQNTSWIIAAVVVVVVVTVIAVVVASTQKKSLPPESTPSGITNPYDPLQRNDNTPPAPTEEQQKEYNRTVEENPLSATEKEELEKRKEFSIDADAPTGQKLVKLKVKDADGLLQPVYDENGGEVYVNRKTYTVGNATYAVINRETLLLVRWYPSSMELKDIVGNRITVNVDNKLMNMDGVQPYSPKSRDDILKKLGDTGMYTSAINPNRMLFRMDDDDALARAMNLKENNIKKGFFETVESAFKNLFGGGNSSKGFFSNFLDILIIVGSVLAGALTLLLIVKFIRALKGKGKT